MEQCLLLNASYEPLKVVDWQRAVTLWCSGRAEIVATYEREVRSVSFSFRLPSVVRLLRFVKVRRAKDFVPFTRANIYARDGHQCQYCGDTFRTQDLTFDHVVPAAQGGHKGWENIVTACVPCNTAKGARTPAEAGLSLLRVPRKPTPTLMLRVTIGVKTAPKEWRDFLYWHAELEES